MISTCKSCKCKYETFSKRNLCPGCYEEYKKTKEYAELEAFRKKYTEAMKAYDNKQDEWVRILSQD